MLKVDDFYMNGSVLKKTLIKGVSTAKPESSSVIYYALKFFDHKFGIHDGFLTKPWIESLDRLENPLQKCHLNADPCQQMPG